MSSSPTPSYKNGRVIRHAGLCLVRGKIRRIWRPRYLELCDNGLVRYYELPPSSSGTSTAYHNEIHSVSPRGNEDLDWDRVSVGGTEQHGGLLNNMGVPKCTLQVLSSRIIDVTTLRDLHVGLPRGQYGFCLYAVRQLTIRDDQECGMQHYPLEPTERDFLCAVSTLEEAQAWVIALQWAASLKPILMVGAGGDNDAGDVMDYYNTGDAPFRSPNHHGRPQRPSVLALPSPSAATARKRHRIKTPSSRKGRIVVSKLRSVSFVRTLQGFDLAYRIQLLLLKSSAGSSTAEERTLLRTHEEIQQLIDALNYEVTSAKSGHVLERAQSVLRASSAPPSRGNYKKMMTLLPKVDGILKSFCMDGGICNSAALRKFWSLGGDTNSVNNTNNHSSYVLQAYPLLVIHDINSIVKQQPIPSTSTRTEAFVKEWLGSTPWERYSDKKAAMAWTLQRPLYVAACIILPLILFRPVLYIRRVWLPSITFKLDTLLLTYAFIWYATKFYIESQQRPIPQTANPTTTPKKMVHTSGSGILDEEEQSTDDEEDFTDGTSSTVAGELATALSSSPKSENNDNKVLSSPLPQYPDNNGTSCWSKPKDSLFKVRSATYLQDRVKLPSGPAPFECRGIDMWLTENAERHIARHPAVCGGKLGDCDTFLVNFLLPFGNFCAYFRVPPLENFPPKLGKVWTEFVRGDQQYRDARLKLLPVVLEGPWIVKTAVGPGTSPALLGKVIPLQYYFSTPSTAGTTNQKQRHCYYEVDVIITASQIAKGILSVVKGHTKALDIAFAFIIEASTEEDLPESVLCSFALHALHLEDCPRLPEHNLDDDDEGCGMSLS